MFYSSVEEKSHYTKKNSILIDITNYVEQHIYISKAQSEQPDIFTSDCYRCYKLHAN